MTMISAIADEPVNDPAIIKDIAFQLKREIDDLFLIVGTVVGTNPILLLPYPTSWYGKRNSMPEKL